jgi:hypothetical protein
MDFSVLSYGQTLLHSIDPTAASCALILIATFYVLNPLQKLNISLPLTHSQTKDISPLGINLIILGLPGGLYNNGNTCFINSVIQAVVSLHHFQNYVISRCRENSDNIEVTKALFGLLTDLNPLRRPYHVIMPSGLTDAIMENKGNDHLIGYNQQGT